MGTTNAHLSDNGGHMMGPVPIQPDRYYVFSATRASRRERRLYY